MSGRPRNPFAPLAFLALLLPTLVARAAEPVDLQMVTRIRDEGLHRSQIQETLEQLTDVIGPRLTGSPQMRRASDWTREQLEEWGLRNARLEPFEFGRGWSFERVSVHMVEPRIVPLNALPIAWTPGTDGPVRGPVERVEIESEDDFEEYEGKLAGKVLLLDDPAEIEPAADPPYRRFDATELEELAEFEIGDGRPSDFIERMRKRYKLREALAEFLVKEQVRAIVRVSSRAGGILRVHGSGAYRIDDNAGVPAIVLAAEQYNQISRLLDREVAVVLELDVVARFHDDDSRTHNTLAEIPGTERKAGLVMVGAHLDSWHAGAGATDNAAGCAVAMEAVRILQALEVRPRRTIRIGLWSGEEQGLKGSRHHVREHFASRPEPEDPEQRKLPHFLREGEEGPLTIKPAHAAMSVYFNLDNGSGRIRGIYAEENAAVKPIFEAWLAPFADLGATTVTLRRTRGTDHQPFDSVGLPGFQFVQDQLAYSSQTHHSNLDVLDHVETTDLQQASVVLASFLYHAAMREEPIPRKPLPKD